MEGRPCRTCDFVVLPRDDGRYICPGCTEEAAPQPEALHHGRARRFWGVLLLGVLTLGLYFLYYNHAVFREVDEEEGVPHWGGVFVASVFCAVAGHSLTVAGGPGPPALQLTAAALFLAALGLQVGYFAVETRQLGAAMRRIGEPGAGLWLLPVLPLVAAVLLALEPLLGVGFGARLLAAAAYVAVYGWLQATLNRYWDRREALGPVAPGAAPA